jgi:transposase
MDCEAAIASKHYLYITTQQGMTVMAHNGAVIVRIRQQQLSKRAQTFRRLLGLKFPKVNEINRPKN